MSTHSNILGWRIPRTEEAGGLQSTGSQDSDTTERLTHRHVTYDGSATVCYAHQCLHAC